MKEFFGLKQQITDVRKEERKEKEIVRLNELVAKHKEEMLGKFCPFANGNCRQDCIHFTSGKVIDYDEFVREHYSRCKLWQR